MTGLKDRILGLVKAWGQASESSLLQLTTDDDDYILDDVIKDAIGQLIEEGKIVPKEIKGKAVYTMPIDSYHVPVHWGWESYLKLIDPWDKVEKEFSSGEWVYSTWRRNPGDEMRWVRKPIPKEMRDGLKIQRLWVHNTYWEYSLIGMGGKAYTLREEVNDCD